MTPVRIKYISGRREFKEKDMACFRLGLLSFRFPFLLSYLFLSIAQYTCVSGTSAWPRIRLLFRCDSISTGIYVIKVGTEEETRRTKDQGQRSKEKRQKTKDKGQRTKYKGQRTKENRQKTKDKGEKTKNIGQRTNNKRQKTKDKR